MRITPEILLNLARDTTSKRAQTDRGLLAAYLHGSILREDPLIGGTTDIDLFFIHTDSAPQEREIVRLTDEIHLDISHHTHALYRQARMLRLHPWLGPTLYGCRILYDPQHILDFIQAGVRGQFDSPDHVLNRSRQQVEHARQIWLELHLNPHYPNPVNIAKYLHAVEHAANAIASLSGPPLTERCFLREFPRRADAAKRPGLYAGLVGLIGGTKSDPGRTGEWLKAWKEAYQALVPEQAPARLHPHRYFYYARAIEALAKSEHPADALWPLFHTWNKVVYLLPDNSPHRETWMSVLAEVGLVEAGFSERVTALDAYLDTVEETLETWGRERGA